MRVLIFERLKVCRGKFLMNASLALFFLGEPFRVFNNYRIDELILRHLLSSPRTPKNSKNFEHRQGWLNFLVKKQLLQSKLWFCFTVAQFSKSIVLRSLHDYIPRTWQIFWHWKFENGNAGPSTFPLSLYIFSGWKVFFPKLFTYFFLKLDMSIVEK